jgi:hypothetical protein
VVVPEPLVLDGDECVDEIGVDAVVGDPSRVAAVGGAGGAERNAVTVFNGHSQPAIRG